MDHVGPIVYLTKRITFSSAHRLHCSKLSAEDNKNIFGKCNNPSGHGHNYTLEVTLRGPPDPVTGMVINLTDLKQILIQVVDTVDHKFIDEDVPFFIESGKVSTVENIAIYLFDKIRERLTDRNLLFSVKLHETSDNWVEYRGE
ncbi:6-pyruvoyl tetrahydrobiopterin synthase purple [Brevipalpus obovatus]|uniref:6-pyruvoyl tetrahydrobiopterin synthase purple n=1 Tax=Brevipalpus obovatus TaxID=246614 RepID=UPI003D9EE032